MPPNVVIRLPINPEPRPELKPTPLWDSFDSIPPLTGADLRKLGASKARLLRICAAALEQDCSRTPVEEFFEEIVHLYGCGRLVPEDFAEELADFEDKFRGMASQVRRFNRDYGWWLDLQKRKAPRGATRDAQESSIRERPRQGRSSSAYRKLPPPEPAG